MNRFLLPLLVLLMVPALSYAGNIKLRGSGKLTWSDGQCVLTKAETGTISGYCPLEIKLEIEVTEGS